MSTVHLLLPAGYDDPGRPSGGNVYDLAVARGLGQLGWTVVVHDILGAWPAPDPAVGDAVDGQLALVPAGRLVVVDGLLATCAAPALVRHAARLRLVALVHMPGPPGGPPGEVLRVMRLVVTTSRWTADVLVADHDLPADRLLVATPGTSRAELAQGTQAGDSLLCVAAVTPAKGHDVLVTALAGLAGRSWTLRCAGALDRDQGFVDGVRQALQDNGIADRVTFTGPLAGADLERAYAVADVMVLPTRLESYGLVVAEAMARGLPVIASAVGGVPEALGAAPEGRRPGVLVPPGDPARLGSAIAGWLDRPELRAGLRSAAQARRASLTGWPATVATISSALTRLSTGVNSSAGRRVHVT